MGVFIELSDFFIGGLVRVADLPNSDEGSYFDPGENAFFSRQPKWRIGVGDELEVAVARVDIEQKFLDFKVVGSTGKGKTRKRTSAKKKQAARKQPTNSNSRPQAKRGGSRKQAAEAPSGRKRSARRRPAKRGRKRQSRTQ